MSRHSSIVGRSTGFLDYLRAQLIADSGWDKMGRERPTEEWADEQINGMTNVELLAQRDWYDQIDTVAA